MMIVWRLHPLLHPLSSAFIVAAGTATSVSAQEFCVACEGPAAVYRCVLEGIGPAQAQPLKVVCITTLAREFKHASCSVRGGTVFDCNGAIKRVNAQGFAPVRPDGTPLPPAVIAEPQKAPLTDSEPPKTVEELAKRVGKSTSESAKQTGIAVDAAVKKTGSAVGDAFKKTGDAIGGAATKTWTCLTTLFKSC